MSSQVRNPAPVVDVAVDTVWERIREEAREIVSREPAMADFIANTVLNHEHFEDALGPRLAQRIERPEVHREMVNRAFADALEAEPEIGAAARADIVAIEDRDPACDRFIEPFLYFKGFHAVQTFRMAHRLWHMGRRDFALYLQSCSSQIFQVDIHPAARMGAGIMVDHATGLVIGGTAVVEDEVSILQGVTLGGTGKDSGDRHPKVRRGVLIGAGAKILGNIEIGECSRIASGSVVLHDVPSNRTVAGVPARIVGFAGCTEPARKMDHMLETPVDEPQ